MSDIISNSKPSYDCEFDTFQMETKCKNQGIHEQSQWEFKGIKVNALVLRWMLGEPFH